MSDDLDHLDPGAKAAAEWGLASLALGAVFSLVGPLGVRPENLPSQGVARKLGMAPEREALHAGLRHVVFAVRRAARSAPPRG